MGRNLWDQAPRRGVRDPPSFGSWMKHWRFEEIRQMMKYAKADLSKVQTDPWAWFKQAVKEVLRISFLSYKGSKV